MCRLTGEKHHYRVTSLFLFKMILAGHLIYDQSQIYQYLFLSHIETNYSATKTIFILF